VGSFGEKPSLTAVCATKWGIHGPLYGYITMGYHGILDGKVMDINPYVVIYIYIHESTITAMIAGIPHDSRVMYDNPMDLRGIPNFWTCPGTCCR